jgi:hypothetical protein
VNRVQRRGPRRHAAYYSVGGVQYGLISLGFVLLVLWLAYNYVSEIREFIRTLPDVWLRGISERT